MWKPMNKINFKIVATEPRLISFSCPLGTSGRVHVVRLRRRFQPPSRHQSTSTLRSRESNIIYDSSREKLSKHIDGRDPRVLGKTGSPERPVDPEEEKAQSLTGEVERTISRGGEEAPEAGDGGPEGIWTVRPATFRAPEAPWTMRAPDGFLRPPTTWVTRRILGDMYNSPVAQDAFDIDTHHPADSQLNKALHSGNRNAILDALIRLIRVQDGNFEGHRVMAKMSPASFSEVLRTLDPVGFVGRYVELHRQISSKNAAYLNIQSDWKTRQLQFVTEFVSRINSIVEARRRTGYTLPLSDYKHLLRCARAVGDPTATRSIWLSMQQAGVKPDMDCYNHYLATIVWSDTLHATRRHGLRILPKNMELRQLISPPHAFSGHKVGPTDGIKRQTATMFHQMVENGLVGDEETFCLLMLAMAREGDINGVKSVLSKVWDLDVDRIMSNQEGDVKFFAVDSPLRPSKTLLVSLTHAFGINNDIPVALRLVDYVSREYCLEIPTVVWEELLDQTYMLCTRRTQKVEITQGNSIGKLPLETVSSLWVALLGEPYNVKPTMSMYDKVVVNALRRQRFREAQQLMQEARKLRAKEFEEYHSTRSLIQRYRSLPYVEKESYPHQTLKDLQRDETYLHLRLHRSGVYLRRWCRLFISLGSASMRRNPTFTAVNLPQFVEKYMASMPRYIEYRIATGFVRFPSQYRQLKQERIKAARRWETRSARRESMPVSDEMINDVESDPLSNSEEFGEFESPFEKRIL